MVDKTLLDKEEYGFLKEDPRLGDNIILLGYGGSHAYGTNVPTSDIDIRGIARNPLRTIIGTENFEQRENQATDTVIYSLNKVADLLANCNPNVIELLGLREEDYFRVDPIGRQLLANKDMFLSRKAQFSFGGYATAQLRRLQNALAHDAYPQAEKNRHILGSLKNAMATFNERYRETDGVNVRLDDKDELVVDMNLVGYPLADARGMISEMRSVIREYDKLNHRNTKKDDAHLNKHAMHLVRLLATGEELLRTGEIHTYREKEHDLLMSIRRGDYQYDDHTFRKEFFEIVDDYEKRFQYAAEHSPLPAKPNMKRIDEFVEQVNLDTVMWHVADLQSRKKTLKRQPRDNAREGNGL